MATSTDFYEIALQRKRQHGCTLISILFMAIIITMLIIFNKEVFDYWHSIMDPYYYPPEWDNNQMAIMMMNNGDENKLQFGKMTIRILMRESFLFPHFHLFLYLFRSVCMSIETKSIVKMQCKLK